jgi:hypothetical protein
VSLTDRVAATERISNDARLLRAQELLASRREDILGQYFPSGTLTDLVGDRPLDCWSECHTVLQSLRALLPFGRLLDQADLDNYFDTTLACIVREAKEQLLYWHLSDSATYYNEPIDTLILSEDDDFLWRTYIPPRRLTIATDLRSGIRSYYLSKFLLTFETIEVTFEEVRLFEFEAHTNGSHRTEDLVFTDGKQFTYNWTAQTWSITLENPEPNLVNPRAFHRPSVPVFVERNDTLPRPPLPRLIPFVNAVLQTPLEVLPPSSPSTTSEWSDPLPNSTWPLTRCWCNNEVCHCDYRPDTPPTPPGVTLWRPGDFHLPSRS